MDASIYFEDRLIIPPAALNFEGFRNWTRQDDFPPRGRVSFIGTSVFVDLYPEELLHHNPAKVAVTTDIVSHVRETHFGTVFGSGARLVIPSSHVIHMPDLMVCSWSTLENERARYVPANDDPTYFAELEGVPDLIVEIAAQSSDRRDRELLPEAYWKGRVPEFWLVLADKEQCEIRLHVWQKDGYRIASADADGFVFSPVLERRCRMTRKFDRIEHYRYHVLIQ